jgi:hypothetical protein
VPRRWLAEVSAAGDRSQYDWWEGLLPDGHRAVVLDVTKRSTPNGPLIWVTAVQERLLDGGSTFDARPEYGPGAPHASEPGSVGCGWCVTAVVARVHAWLGARNARGPPRHAAPRRAASGSVRRGVVDEPPARAQWAELTAALRARSRLLAPLAEVAGRLPVALPAVPPGMRVVVVGDDVRLPRFADGLVAFGWTDPDVAIAREGVVVVPWSRVVEIAEHIAAGRLPAGWWYRLLVHVRDAPDAPGWIDQYVAVRPAALAGELAEALPHRPGGAGPAARP